MRWKVSSEIITKTLFLVPIALLVLVVVLRVFSTSILNAIAREDRLFENIQAVLYLTASVLVFVSVRSKFRDKAKNAEFWIYILAGSSLLFWGMEEISWGQRIFNWETGDFFMEHNLQGETTLHNTGIIGMSIDYIHLFITGTAVATIQFRDQLAANRFTKPFADFFPQKKQLLYFLIPFVVFLLYLTVRYWDWFWWTSQLDTRELETAELMISMGIFWIVLDNFSRIRRQLEVKSSEKNPAAD